MLAEQCLLTGSNQGAVLLTVTPRILAAALDEAKEGLQSPEEAEADFVTAVTFVYKEHVLRRPERLRALKSSDKTEVPLSVGFLALSVLAAYRMRTDGERTGRAYYARLGEMVGCGLVGNFPLGFDPDAFVELWDELAQWLETQYGRRLVLPVAGGVQKFVAYPLAHVPLRRVDIDRLPQFFDSYGYEPGMRAPLDSLAYDLYKGAGPWRHLTRVGQRALEDPGRRPFVIRQVAHELEHWDGCRTDSYGTRIATIALWMDIRRRRVQLSLLARRPQGFPEEIENEDLVFVSSQEGWYEPILLGPDDGALLSEGLRIDACASGSRCLLQLRGFTVVPLTPSEEYAGLVSDSVLRAGTRCAVLCAESMIEDVSRYLELLNNGPVYPRRDENLPKGWCLFTDVELSSDAAPPVGLERLRAEASIALVPVGGLRLGRRWTWLEGASACLRIVGARQGLEVRVDGQEAKLDSEGHLPAALLRAEGTHVVEVGNRLRQLIAVLPGAVNPECRSWECNEPILSRIPVAVPEGHWAVIGSVPGELATVFASSEGALIRPDFFARWAVKIGTRRSATALHLHDVGASLMAEWDRDDVTRIQAPCLRAGFTSAQSWAEIIYQAGIRRPHLVCTLKCQVQELAAEWRRLMEKARSVKREIKRGRR